MESTQAAKDYIECQANENAKRLTSVRQQLEEEQKELLHVKVLLSTATSGAKTA